MRRHNTTIPSNMVQRWSRPPLSCQLCRAKKLRCDRARPCTNCSTRDRECVYVGRGLPGRSRRAASEPSAPASPKMASHMFQYTESSSEEVRSRLQRLEQAVFHSQTPKDTFGAESRHNGSLPPQLPAPDNADVQSRARQTESVSTNGSATLLPEAGLLGLQLQGVHQSQSLAHFTQHLPPRYHAILLFEHFYATIQLAFGVLHIRTSNALLEQTYQVVAQGGELSPADLLLLFSIFANATLVATPLLQSRLGVTKAGAKSALDTYTRLALTLVDQTAWMGQESTPALQGMVSLMHLLIDMEGFSERVHVLQARVVAMAQRMQIHRLDTARSNEERRANGYNAMEVEIQRRIWWYLVSTDWLLAVSGGSQEGTCIFQPKHMKVNYPRNVDANLLTTCVSPVALHRSVPTTMSGFICRIRLADLCREVVDTVPSMWLDPHDIDYELILGLDAKFQRFLDDLPYFFQLGEANAQESRQVYQERPYMHWQRTMIHFGTMTRICRLHRPFHLESASNPQYAYSRVRCVRAAQTILELRQMLDDGPASTTGLDGSRCWAVTQHVFLAALTLATDLCIDPCASETSTSARKAEVLDACRTLEALAQGSDAAVDGLRRGVQMLRSMVHRQKKPPVDPLARDLLPVDMPLQKTPALDEPGIEPLLSLGEQGWDWDRLWSEFFESASTWDLPQWNLLLEDMDLTLNPSI